jgi:TRAP-type C4-dicarboxylate transport system permease small subunit
MMLFTTYAVSMRNFFDSPVLGVVDIMELSLVALIFIAMPGVFLRDENVTVDVIDQIVSRKVRVALRFFGLILTLGFLVMMLVEMMEPAMDKYTETEFTMTLEIDRFIHWMPILFGFVFSIIATIWVIFLYARHGVPRDPILDADLIKSNPSQKV